MPYGVRPGMISNRMERRKPYATEEEVPVTRIDSVRNAADTTKDSVRQAAAAAAPYASTARDEAARYAQQAGRYARRAYDDKLAAQLRQARGQAWSAMPPKAADAMETAAKRTREAADYTVPKVVAAVAATRAVAVPVANEAVVRGSAAVQALRGQVTAAEIERLVRRRVRRERTARAFRTLAMLGLAGGVALAAWRWWSAQANPEWLVEPSEATEAAEGETLEEAGATSTLTVVDPLDSPQSVNGKGGAHMDRVDGSAGTDPEAAPESEGSGSEEDKPGRDGA
jgi:vacuolar-type H+-ATPase subunit H